jgi:hypothetical protein
MYLIVDLLNQIFLELILCFFLLQKFDDWVCMPLTLRRTHVANWPKIRRLNLKEPNKNCAT